MRREIHMAVERERERESYTLLTEVIDLLIDIIYTLYVHKINKKLNESNKKIGGKAGIKTEMFDTS